MTRWTTFFGLSEPPFSKEIGDAELWVPSSRQGAVDRLVEACRERGHALLIGEPGVVSQAIPPLLSHAFS